MGQNPSAEKVKDSLPVTTHILLQFLLSRVAHQVNEFGEQLGGNYFITYSLLCYVANMQKIRTHEGGKYFFHSIVNASVVWKPSCNFYRAHFKHLGIFELRVKKWAIVSHHLIFKRSVSHSLTLFFIYA